MILVLKLEEMGFEAREKGFWSLLFVVSYLLDCSNEIVNIFRCNRFNSAVGTCDEDVGFERVAANSKAVNLFDSQNGRNFNSFLGHKASAMNG